MANTRLRNATSEISEFFEASEKSVFKRSELGKILVTMRHDWNLNSGTTLRKFIAFLTKETKLVKVELAFPYRTETRFLWGDVSEYEVALSLRPQSYLTHRSAMHLNSLAEQPPNIIYVNHEQRPKRFRDRCLAQERIDLAFKRPVRVSQNRARYKDKTICILNGMHTGQYGVITQRGRKGELLRLTNIERTLVDIVVRPVYSGGVPQVLDAYRSAKDKVSIRRLADTLRALDHIYPYHQAIGFCLEKSGTYDESSKETFVEFEMNFDFYLEHQMLEMDYSRNWRLYYPRGL